MGDVINLRAVRKAVAKAASAQKSDENATKFGRSKAEKALQVARAIKAKRDLDGKRIE